RSAFARHDPHAVRGRAIDRLPSQYRIAHAVNLLKHRAVSRLDDDRSSEQSSRTELELADTARLGDALRSVDERDAPVVSSGSHPELRHARLGDVERPRADSLCECRVGRDLQAVTEPGLACERV